MRSVLSILALGAVASVSGAALQARQNYPACVATCIGTSQAASGCGGVGAAMDAACLCQSETFVNSAAQCFATSCNAEDAATGVALGQQLCAAVGFTVSIPAYASSVLADGPASSAAGAQSSTVAPAATSSSASSAAAATSTPAAASAPVASSPAAAAPTGAASALTGNTAFAGLAVLGAAFAILA